MIDYAFDERVTQALLDRAGAPGIFSHFHFALLLHGIGKLDEPLGRIGPAVQQHIFNKLQQVFRNLFVDFEHSGIHDSHVEPGVDRVIQKRRMHRFAHDSVAAK